MVGSKRQGHSAACHGTLAAQRVTSTVVADADHVAMLGDDATTSAYANAFA